MSSLAGSKNSTGSIILRNFYSLEIPNLIDCVYTENLAGFDQVKKGDYIQVISTRPFHLWITKIEEKELEMQAALSYFQLGVSLTGMGYTIDVIHNNSWKTLTATEAAIIELGSVVLNQKGATRVFAKEPTMGQLVGFSLEGKKIETAVIDYKFGGAKSHHDKPYFSINALPLEGYTIEQSDGEGLRVSVLKQVQRVTLYAPPKVQEVVIEDRKGFIVEIQNLYQCAISDQLKGFKEVRQGDFLKVLCTPAPVILQIDEMREIQQVSNSMAYFQIEASSQKVYSIEMYDGHSLKTCRASEIKIKEIALGACTLGQNKSIPIFPSIEKGDILTFELQAKKIHTLVTGFQFGTQKGSAPCSFSIKKFLNGYEIDLDDGRGPSVITVQEIPVLYSYKF